MILEPFRIEHLDEITLHPEQADWREHGSREYALSLAEHRAYTVRTNRIVACFGSVPWSRDVGHLWSFICAKPPMQILHRVALRFFETAQPRILTNAACSSVQMKRWFTMLGFKEHDTLPGFGPDGRDHMLYLRIR